MIGSIGFHLQNNVSGWLEAVAKLPDYGLVKCVTGAERCRNIKQIKPNLTTWYRWVAPHQNLAAGNYVSQAREWFARYVDGTFLSGAVAPYVDLLQEPFNEYHNNGHSEAERRHWEQWTEACAQVWADYRTDYPQLADMRLVLGGAGVGNDLTLDNARVAVAYDCVLDSHSYTPMADRQIMPDSGTHPNGTEINCWKYYDGRFSYMDEYFVANGYRVRWALGEGGPVRDASPWWGNLQPNDGWRHPGCCNKSVSCYLSMVDRWLEKATQTTTYREGRLYGMTLFTTGGGSMWSEFETRQPEMNAIADRVRLFDYPPIGEPPPPPPPPPPDGLKNGSFEDGWEDQSMTAQEPNEWELTTKKSGNVRGNQVSGQPECVHKHKDQLPADEQPGGENALILEGDYVYKMFTSATWAASLSQSVSGLEPGAMVTLTVPVNVHFDGRGDVYDEDDTLVTVLINGEAVSELWINKENEREWHYLRFNRPVPADSSLDIAIIASVKWAHPTAVFIDNITLEIEEEPMPDETWKQELWAESIRLQTIQLNPDAALQAAIFADDFVPVESEFWHAVDGIQYAAQAAETLDTGERRVYYAIVPNWGNVQWFNEPVPVGVFVDVSHWQGVMNWAEAKAAGVTHAYIKVSESESVDPQFATNWQGAKDAGIQRGAYHYFLNHIPASDQAAYFLEQLNGDTGELPPALDVEDTNGQPAQNELREWLNIVADHIGVQPVIYTAKWFWDQHVGQTDWAGDYGLWVANYTNADEPQLPNDWSEWRIWQYAADGDGSKYGASSSKIDLNRV